jgi:hypothetical protein
MMQRKYSNIFHSLAAGVFRLGEALTSHPRWTPRLANALLLTSIAGYKAMMTEVETLSGDFTRAPCTPGGWIASPGFDLTFFILSPLAGLALLFISPLDRTKVIHLAAATLIGGPHYLATYSFYFWDDTAAYHRRRWVAYFVVPILIILAVGGIAWFKIPVVIIVVIYFWNAYHVARQSCGIQSIYRYRAGAFDPRLKTVTNAAIISTNMAMAVAHLDWYPALYGFLSKLSPYLPDLLSNGAVLVAAVSVVRLAIAMFQRHRQGPSFRAAELAFLATSLLLFHPYLWVHDADLATLGMLVGHFIQYLGIVWLLNSRKLADGTGSLGQRALSRLWRDPWVLVPALVATGALFMVLQVNLMAVTITLVLLHFYLDSLFWAFKQPEVRRAMAPYLTDEAYGRR